MKSKLLILSFLTCFLLSITSVYALPAIIAHRGGGHNFPENTVLSFSKSLEMGCDALELDVQVTKDGMVVVYHPEDLKQWTNGTGKICDHYWTELANLNAAYNFKPEENYPFRTMNLKIPKLEEVLKLFPKTLIIIDMKSLPVEPLVQALFKTISDKEAQRLLFYSTSAEHLDALQRNKPNWRCFEKRDISRQRLLELNQTGQSELPVTDLWIGFELKRKMVVTETFALGKGTSTVEFHLWHPEVVSDLRSRNSKVSLVLFGINKKEEWERAVNLDVDAIYTDNPQQIIKLKTNKSLK